MVLPFRHGGVRLHRSTRMAIELELFGLCMQGRRPTAPSVPNLATARFDGPSVRRSPRSWYPQPRPTAKASELAVETTEHLLSTVIQVTESIKDKVQPGGTNHKPELLETKLKVPR